MIAPAQERFEAAYEALEDLVVSSNFCLKPAPSVSGSKLTCSLFMHQSISLTLFLSSHAHLSIILIPPIHSIISISLPTAIDIERLIPHNYLRIYFSADGFGGDERAETRNGDDGMEERLWDFGMARGSVTRHWKGLPGSVIVIDAYMRIQVGGLYSSV